ncbi:hypothetical protein YB2330_000450 [Saitoella coloradoensis]
MVYYPRVEPAVIPTNLSIPQFILDQPSPKYETAALHTAKSLLPSSLTTHFEHPVFVDGATGEQIGISGLRKEVDDIAKGLLEIFDFDVEASEMEKVIVVFCHNTIHTPPIMWAAHRLNGVISGANPAYTAPELTHQMLDSRARLVVTHSSYLPTVLPAAEKANVPRSNIITIDSAPSTGILSLDELIARGRQSSKTYANVKWGDGEAKRRVAFLNYSSGTTGLPKGVMVSHYNVISNVCQHEKYEQSTPGWEPKNDVVLGLLPFYHIYGLIALVHLSPHQRSTCVIMAKFDFKTFLDLVTKYRIAKLPLVPPIVILLAKHDLVLQYDLSHVDSIGCGAAPLTAETIQALHERCPQIIMRQGYGMTETATTVTGTRVDDVMDGSSGCLLPNHEAKIVDPTSGKEILEYDTPGELWVKGPNVVMGYLNNPKADAETFTPDGFIKTGDEALVKFGPKGTEHFFIVDRIKELIKVKGMQVAPAELEGHLLKHHKVADAAVIPIYDPYSDQVPKAIVVLKPQFANEDMKALENELKEWVAKEKAPHKRLKGGVEFRDVLPKSPSGKLLRRVLVQEQKEKEKANAGSGSVSVKAKL